MRLYKDKLLWEKHKEPFRDKQTGLVDEEALKAKIATLTGRLVEDFERDSLAFHESMIYFSGSAFDYSGQEYTVAGGKSGNSVANP